MSRPLVVVVACAVLAGAGLLVWQMTQGGAPAGLGRSDSGVPEAAPSGALADGAPDARLAPGAIKPRRLEAGDEAEAPESAPAAAMDLTHLYVTGKVIDDWRRPAPGATVDLMIEGRDPLRGKSGADGRFRIDLGLKPGTAPRGAVHASDATGRVALVSIHEWTPWNPEPVAADGVIDVGTLPLSDGRGLAVRVTKDGAPAAGARVYVGASQTLGLGPFVTDEQGSLGTRRFPEGQRTITAFSANLALRGETSVDVGQKSGPPVEVALSPAWRLAVFVKDAAGKPVAGQRLNLMTTVSTENRGMFSYPPTLPYLVKPTDAEGRSVIAGLSPERAVTVTAAADGSQFGWGGSLDGSARAQAKPGTEEVVLTVGEGGETFTFPIVADETDGPPDGAELKLSVPEGYGGAPPPALGKVAGRNVVIDGVTKGCINILATADDGTRALLRILGEARNTKVGSEAKFKRPRTLFVTAHDRAGKPLSGEVVHCRSQGNSPLGKEATIGGDGTARIEGLSPQKVDVTIRRKGERSPFGGRTAGSADLTKGDARLELVVEQARECVLYVTVDGEKRLPATFRVNIAAERGMGGGDVGAIEEDPEKAVLRFSVRPDPKQASLNLDVSGKGCPLVTVALAIPKDDSVLEGTAALVTGGKVLIHVLPPSDNIHSVSLETWSAERSSWTPRRGGGFMPGFEEPGKKPTEITVDSLPAGRYRATDSSTGIVTEPFDLAAGASGEVTIDLSRAGVVTGRVEGPVEGEPSQAPDQDVIAQRRASVFVEGAGLGSRRDLMMGSPDGGIQVRINSEFKTRVPGDRPVTLRVTHQLYAPDPVAGKATVTAPGSAVVLKLVAGPEASFIPTPRKTALEVTRDFLGSRAKVLLFSGKPEGEPVKTCQVSWGAVARFGGYEPGKYTLWCDPGEAAPFVLEDVKLGEGRTDLGEVKLVEGATLRVSIVTREGQDPPSAFVTATPLAGPSYSRRANSGRKSEMLVKGLGPGKFKVEVRSGDFRAAPAAYEVESTGSGEIPLTHDVR
jgi:hypothetical protein